MSDKNKITVSGGTFNLILFLVFLILKLTGTIDWSWWWITAPLWIPVGLVLLWIITIFIITLCLTK